MIGDVLNDRLWIEMGFASLIMGIGWWHSQAELKYWLILSALGIFVLVYRYRHPFVSFSRLDRPNVCIGDTGIVSSRQKRNSIGLPMDWAGSFIG